MKSRKLAAAATLSAAALFAGSGRLEARAPRSSQAVALSEQGYENLRGMAEDLDRSAQRSADPQRSRSYDRDVQRAVTNFARRAHSFNQRVANYRSQPFEMEGELDGLLADATSIERRLEQSRRDPRLVEEWTRNVQTLDAMLQANRPGSGGGHSDRGGQVRNEQEGRTEGPAYRDGGGSSSTARLVSDVSERASRLSERAKQLAGPIPADERQRMAWMAIQKLAQDTSALAARIDRSGEPRDLKTAVAQLNADAAEADRQIRAGNVFPEIKTQWADLMQSISRLRQSAGS